MTATESTTTASQTNAATTNALSNGWIIRWGNLTLTTSGGVAYLQIGEQIAQAGYVRIQGEDLVWFAALANRAACRISPQAVWTLDMSSAADSGGDDSSMTTSEALTALDSAQDIHGCEMPMSSDVLTVSDFVAQSMTCALWQSSARITHLAVTPQQWRAAAAGVARQLCIHPVRSDSKAFESAIIAVLEHTLSARVFEIQFEQPSPPVDTSANESESVEHASTDAVQSETVSTTTDTRTPAQQLTAATTELQAQAQALGLTLYVTRFRSSGNLHVRWSLTTSDGSHLELGHNRASGVTRWRSAVHAIRSRLRQL